MSQKQQSIKELYYLLKNATLWEEDQEIINKYAVALADKIYIPNKEQSYESLLNTLGYKELPHKRKVK